MADQPDGASLKSETYYVVPDGIPARVYFTVPRGGWVSWIGTYNPETKAPYRHVGLSIINVRNLVTDGCKNHDQRQPPVGPTVDDLATALTELPPFEVTIPPQDMTLGRFRGKSLQLRIPDLPFREDSSGITYPECEAQVLKSWIGSPLSYAFYGYTDPGSTETFWILDVEGNRVVISAISSPKSPKSQLDDLRSLMESIRIRPIR